MANANESPRRTLTSGGETAAHPRGGDTLTSSIPAAPIRIAYLDSLRGLAALVVAVFWHYRHFSAEYQPGAPPIASAPFYHAPLFHLAYCYGEYSVDFFFILSGIIFSHVYWQRIGMRECSLREYAAARFARLYPIHLATLILITPLLWGFHHYTGRYPLYHHNNLTLFLINLLFLQGGFTHTRNSFNGPAWSLSVEAFLYCIFFALARRRVGYQGPLAMFAIGALILASGMNHAFLANSYIGRGLVGFALGMMIYRTGSRPQHERMFFVALLVIGALSLLLIRSGWPHLAHIFGAALLALILMVIRRLDSVQRGLEIGALMKLGDLSLAIYMIHVPLQCVILLGAHLLHVTIPYRSAWFLCSYAAMVVAAAWLIHRYYEAPARTWVRRWLTAPHTTIASQYDARSAGLLS